MLSVTLSIPLGELDFLGRGEGGRLGEDYYHLSIPLGELDFLGQGAPRFCRKGMLLSIPLGELDFLGHITSRP